MRSVIRARLTTSLCSTYISVVTAVFFGDDIFFIKYGALVSFRGTFAYTATTYALTGKQYRAMQSLFLVAIITLADTIHSQSIKTSNHKREYPYVNPLATRQNLRRYPIS